MNFEIKKKFKIAFLAAIICTFTFSCEMPLRSEIYKDSTSFYESQNPTSEFLMPASEGSYNSMFPSNLGENQQYQKFQAQSPSNFNNYSQSLTSSESALVNNPNQQDYQLSIENSSNLDFQTSFNPTNLSANSSANNFTKQRNAGIASIPQNKFDWCKNRKFFHERILKEAKIDNESAIKNLPICFKQDRSLMVKLALINPNMFRFADDLLKQDESFVKRMINVNPQTLQFASTKLLKSRQFIHQAIMNNRESLKYADFTLLDNLHFMTEMIDIDANNYRFASDRIKAMESIVKAALEDNGMLLEFTPESIQSDFELVKTAITSNRLAIKFASKNLQNNSQLQLIARSDDVENYADFANKDWKDNLILKSFLNSDLNLLPTKNFEKQTLNFLRNSYLLEATGKNLGMAIGNSGRFFPKNRLISRNFVSKWKKSLNFDLARKADYREEWRLVPVRDRNFNISWRKDFDKISGLTERIEDFFLEHGLSADNINDLQTTYLWKIKNLPITYGFNIYMLRDSKDEDLGSDFANVTSLTAIAQKNGERWRLSVVEAIFDKEILVKPSYSEGHERYILWDLLPFNYSKICQESSKQCNEDYKTLEIDNNLDLVDNSNSKKSLKEIKILYKKNDRIYREFSQKISIENDQNHSKKWIERMSFKNAMESNPKIIFRVEGAVEDHFEIFEEQKSGKYQMIYRSPTLPSLLDFKNLER